MSEYLAGIFGRPRNPRPKHQDAAKWRRVGHHAKQRRTVTPPKPRNLIWDCFV